MGACRVALARARARGLTAVALAAALLTGCAIGPGPDRPTPVPDRLVDYGSPLEAADLCEQLGADETTALAEAYGYDPGRAEPLAAGMCIQYPTRFEDGWMRERMTVIIGANTWDGAEEAAAAYERFTDPGAIVFRLRVSDPDLAETVAIGGDWEQGVLVVDRRPGGWAQVTALVRSGPVVVDAQITVSNLGTDLCSGHTGEDCAIGAETVRDWTTTVLLPAVHEHLDEAGHLTG